MRVIKGKKNKSLFFKLALIIFVGYVVTVLVTQHIQIANKQKQLDSLNSQIRIQEIKKDEMKSFLESNDEKNQEYAKKVAKENLGFVEQGERVFINIAGN